MALTVGANGSLDIGLSDSLRVNGRDQSSLTKSETGKLPPLAPKAIRLILSRSFFEAKTDLIAAMRSHEVEVMRLLGEIEALVIDHDMRRAQ